MTIVTSSQERSLPTLTRIHKARSTAEWLKYVASALIVGGGTVALTLLLAGTIIQMQVYVVLYILYGLLLVEDQFLIWRTHYNVGRNIPPLWTIVVPGAFIVFFAITGPMHVTWPVKPYTNVWWQVFAVALGVSTLGVVKRRTAEIRMEELDEMEQQHREVMKMTKYVQVLTTVDSAEMAEQLARTIISARLATCAQIVGPIRSVCRRQDKVEDAQEWQLLVRTMNGRLPELERHIKANHSYDTPEIIATEIP
jgi:periplasmic divalent cation tolerance protein